MHHGPFQFHFGTQDDVIVHHVLDASRPEGYPEIKVEDGVASPVRIFPTRRWLERLTEAAFAYLAAHPEEPVADDDDGGPFLPCLDPACTGELREQGDQWTCLTCGAAYVEEALEYAHENCDHLGGDCEVFRRRRLHRRESGAGTEVVDSDELLATMAASYDVRRAAWEGEPGD